MLFWSSPLLLLCLYSYWNHLVRSCWRLAIFSPFESVSAIQYIDVAQVNNACLWLKVSDRARLVHRNWQVLDMIVLLLFLLNFSCTCFCFPFSGVSWILLVAKPMHLPFISCRIDTLFCLWQTTFEDVFPSEATTVEEYLQQVGLDKMMEIIPYQCPNHTTDKDSFVFNFCALLACHRSLDLLLCLW